MMNTLMSVLHVVAAVFLVGPLAILPMSGLRAIRGGQGGQVATLGRSTLVTALLSLLVVVFGFGAMGTSDPKYDLSITTPWILWSLISYAVAVALTLLLVVPAMRTAAETLANGGDPKPQYVRVAAPSGIATLLLVVPVVLMVWKP
jgi:uncharacterized membrane protein